MRIYLFIHVLLTGQIYVPCLRLGLPLSKPRRILVDDGLDAHVVVHLSDSCPCRRGNHGVGIGLVNSILEFEVALHIDTALLQ